MVLPEELQKMALRIVIRLSFVAGTLIAYAFAMQRPVLA